MPKPRDPKAGDPRVVWSTDDGDLRRYRDPGTAGPAAGSPGGPARGSPEGSPEGSPAGSRGPGSGRVEVRRETAGRRGKAVTTVRGLPLDDDGLRMMAGRLKRRCGVGGSAKGGVIELQGDHRTVVVDELRAAGYRAVVAGG